jgi:putative membrane protein
LQQLQQQPDQAPDKLFVIGAAIDNMYEMQLTHQAMQKAQNQQVKQLAQRLMEDHQQMSTQLQQVARQMNVQVPQGLPSIKQQEVQVIASLPAEQFEKQYVAKMNEQHSKDVTCFGSQMSLAQSQQLKQFVTQQLPKLQQHQQQVLQTAAAIGITNQAEAQQAGSRQPAERQQQDRQQQDQQR